MDKKELVKILHEAKHMAATGKGMSAANRIIEALALLDKPQPVTDGARELAHRVDNEALSVRWGECEGLDIDRAAALITQALREEREKVLDALKREATWSMAQDGTHTLWFTEASLRAAIMGEEE